MYRQLAVTSRLRSAGAMKVVFKAPIADEDIPPIVEYLAKTYGNEQPK